MEKKTVLDKKTVEGVEKTADATVTGEALEPVKTRKPAKRKCKPRGGNSPVIGMNGYNLENGDNSKFMKVQIALFNMPDIDMEDKEEVAQRLSDYFQLYAENDMKPTVTGMALALNGMSRQTLRAIATDAPTGGAGYKTALPRDIAALIKKAYRMMENLWETYMNSGKVNPVAGIFLGKNNYGYQDKTEYVLTPNTRDESDYSPDEIRERYIAADKDKRLSQGGEDEDSSND